jgi:hypothetical protein
MNKLSDMEHKVVTETVSIIMEQVQSDPQKLAYWVKLIKQAQANENQTNNS